MQVRIEVGAERLDGSDAALLEQFRELALNQFEAGLERLRFRRRRRREGAIEIVDDRQQIADHVGRRPFDHVLAIAIDALAEVVELGGLAQQAIVADRRVPSAARAAARRCPARRLVGRCGGRVSWIEWLFAHDLHRLLRGH